MEVATCYINELFPFIYFFIKNITGGGEGQVAFLTSYMVISMESFPTQAQWNANQRVQIVDADATFYAMIVLRRFDKNPHRFKGSVTRLTFTLGYNNNKRCHPLGQYIFFIYVQQETSINQLNQAVIGLSQGTQRPRSLLVLASGCSTDGCPPSFLSLPVSA